VLHSPNFLSMPMIIASTDLVMTVPELIGELFGRIVDLQVLRFPFPIPAVDIKQYWHRSQHGDPGNRWLRSIVMDVFHE
jgi:hypothetical protein